MKNKEKYPLGNPLINVALGIAIFIAGAVWVTVLWVMFR